MQILPLNAKVNCQLQSQNSQKGKVNFGAERFLATPAKLEQLQREYGWKGTTLTDFIEKFNLGNHLKTALKRWLPDYVNGLHGEIQHGPENIFFNPMETGRLEMIVKNLGGNNDSAERYKSLETIMDEYIKAIPKTVEKTVAEVEEKVG